MNPLSDELELADPADVGLCPHRWQQVLQFAQQLCDEQVVPAIGLQVQRQGRSTGVHSFGSRSLSTLLPVTPDTRFLIASLTKPMVAMAVLLLVEQGKLSLSQRVVEWVPEFREGAKRPITIRNLLTHTSGLPDMLPANEELRRGRAPLSTFVAGTCLVDLLFQPGRAAQYQSMGYALLGPVIEAASGRPYRDFIREHLFLPLGMCDSHLGLPEEQLDDPRIAQVRVAEPQQGGDEWNWNSRYWRQLGAPWGGAICTVSDVSRFCRAMFTGGQLTNGSRLFSPASLAEALENRLPDFPAIPEPDARTRGWGLGWRMNWKDSRGAFSDLLPGDVVGHWGATGCLYWLDRRRQVAAVLLSTQPVEKETPPLLRLSNMIAGALEG